MSKLSSNLGIADGMLSGFSDATASGCVGNCLAGSVTYMDFTNTSYSSIGQGVILGGASALGADPLTSKVISVRNALNEPVPEATVTLKPSPLGATVTLQSFDFVVP